MREGDFKGGAERVRKKAGSKQEVSGKSEGSERLTDAKLRF
jgi:hypothetical protein